MQQDRLSAYLLPVLSCRFLCYQINSRTQMKTKSEQDAHWEKYS